MTDEQFEILQRIYRGEHDIEDRSSREENDIIESCIQERWIRVTSSCNLDVTRRGSLAMGAHLDACQHKSEQDAKAEAESRKANLFAFAKFVLEKIIGIFVG